uniref:Uncharacterized protein n=1 Tax=Tanacetum cinerariifolium TaxID=118510 RepID=A0A699JL78_TANCI|nr:hypothetical protein [Tanacetum cinerariifolium]
MRFDHDCEVRNTKLEVMLNSVTWVYKFLKIIMFSYYLSVHEWIRIRRIKRQWLEQYHVTLQNLRIIKGATQVNQRGLQLNVCFLKEKTVLKQHGLF